MHDASAQSSVTTGPGNPHPALSPTYSQRLHHIITTAHDSITLTAYATTPPNKTKSQPLKQIWDDLKVARARALTVTMFINTQSPPHSIRSRNLQTAEQLSAAGIHCRLVHPHYSLHAKLLLADSATLILGSHNLTDSSQTTTLEASAITHNLDTIQEALAFIQFLYANSKPYYTRQKA